MTAIGFWTGSGAIPQIFFCQAIAACAQMVITAAAWTTPSLAKSSAMGHEMNVGCPGLAVIKYRLS